MKLVTFIWLAFVLIVVAPLTWDALDRHAAADRYHKFHNHWVAVVEAEVPIGATREQVLGWIENHFPGQVSPSDHKDKIVGANPGSVPAGGFGIPCSDAGSMIEFEFGPNDRVVSRRIYGLHSCL